MHSNADCPEERVCTVPLFALPSVVLFPRAILPLHIFEERYKQMTADLLGGDRLIAMALLRPGWEKEYYSRPAVEPVVCVGKIVSSERLDDGQYNFLLHGMMRGRIIHEEPSSPYRIVRVAAIRETSVVEIDLTNQRQRMMEMFSAPPLACLPGCEQLRKIVASNLGTAEVADLIAYHLLADVWVKQSLLAEADVIRRVGRVIAAIEAATPMLELAATGESDSGAYN